MPKGCGGRCCGPRSCSRDCLPSTCLGVYPCRSRNRGYPRFRRVSMDETMTPRQRLLVALACKEPDRVPITLHGVYPYQVGENWRCAHPSYRPLLDSHVSATDPLCSWSLDAGTFYADLPVHDRPLDDEDFIERTIETPHGDRSPRSVTSSSSSRRCTSRTTRTSGASCRFATRPYDPICRRRSSWSEGSRAWAAVRRLPGSTRHRRRSLQAGGLRHPLLLRDDHCQEDDRESLRASI